MSLDSPEENRIRAIQALSQNPHFVVVSIKEGGASSVYSSSNTETTLGILDKVIAAYSNQGAKGKKKKSNR